MSVCCWVRFDKPSCQLMVEIKLHCKQVKRIKSKKHWLKSSIGKSKDLFFSIKDIFLKISELYFKYCFHILYFLAWGQQFWKEKKKNCKLKKRKEKSHFQSIGKKTNFWDLFKGVKKNQNKIIFLMPVNMVYLCAKDLFGNKENNKIYQSVIVFFFFFVNLF